ncbi:prepilin-type N-terminal cleavage/methylation domain-containing protein [Tahibacter amnicola]|uniref:Prepilin-type N-terminal cleavage/methylation domain-containing protein n=1 Tax=Tahibacter amnicola TaxID=2976241 RepID=A0ABY6BDE9_9GAMM|nr:prepilin-type N-terminal cleavage/methylation domain-containing protein [Tahibacter amnicola]UXI67567.1 prepilin-type N-terminal cleavage/methylation domain-containing protein [Tahibacter amnicola]
MSTRTSIAQTAAAGVATRAAGFTLIEILVIVVILAVLAAAVSMSLSGGGGERQLERESERLQALLGYACERAEIGGHAVAFFVLPGGYGFSEFKEGGWKPFSEGELRQRSWPGPIRAELSRDGILVEVTTEPPASPAVACHASGELTPFRLELGIADLSQRWRLEGDIAGDLKRERVDASR